MTKLKSYRCRHGNISNGEPNAEVWTSADVSGIFTNRRTDWELYAYLSESPAAHSFEG